MPNEVISKRSLVGGSQMDSPLTPALSPLRGEGARQAVLIRVTSFAAFVAFRLNELFGSEPNRTRRDADRFQRMPVATPSPLNGERAGG